MTLYLNAPIKIGNFSFNLNVTGMYRVLKTVISNKGGGLVINMSSIA